MAAGAAQAFVLEDGVAVGIAGDAYARVLQHCGERDGLGGIVREFAEQCDQAASVGLAQRRAVRDAGLDAPTRKLGFDAAREAGVGRDDGGVSGRLFELFAQHERDGGGFFVFGGGFKEAQAARALFHERFAANGSETRDPVGGFFCRRQCFAHQHPAGATLFVLELQHGHLVTLNAKRGERVLQRILRVLIADQAPAVVVEIDIDVRENDNAFRQTRNDLHQLARRRLRAGGAGDDDRAFRRIGLPPRGKCVAQSRAVFGRIADALLFQVRGPEGGDDVEEISGAGPMTREIDFFDELWELLPIDFHDRRGAIEQFAEFIGQRDGARGIVDAILRHRAPADERSELHAPLHLVDRRQNVGADRIGTPNIGIVISVRIAEWADRRQQRRAAEAMRERIDEPAR